MKTISGAILVLAGVVALVGVSLVHSTAKIAANGRELYTPIPTPVYMVGGVLLLLTGLGLLVWGLVADSAKPPHARQS
jgi:hypothetical protein